MNILTRIALTALAGATTLTGLGATPAVARTDVNISYRDGNYRDSNYREVRGWRDGRDYRRDDRRDRYDRYDRRRDRGYYGAYGGYGYRNSYRPRCWTERQWDRWRGSYAVRVCR
jgi:hypothetical protein